MKKVCIILALSMIFISCSNKNDSSINPFDKSEDSSQISDINNSENNYLSEISSENDDASFSSNSENNLSDMLLPKISDF